MTSQEQWEILVKYFLDTISLHPQKLKFFFQGGLGMVKNSFLYPIFDEVMRKLIPSGIPQYLPAFHSQLLYGTFIESGEHLPKILTLDDLAFGFIMWMIACGISVASFVGEMLRHKTVKMMKNYLGLALLLAVVQKRMQRV